MILCFQRKGQVCFVQVQHIHTHSTNSLKALIKIKCLEQGLKPQTFSITPLVLIQQISYITELPEAYAQFRQMMEEMKKCIEEIIYIWQPRHLLINDSIALQLMHILCQQALQFVTVA